MGNEIKYYKEIRKKSGEVKQKPISQKKWERKAEKSTSDSHLPSEKQDRLELLRYPGGAKYDSKGKTSQRKIVKKGEDQKIKKAFVKETFEPGKAPPPPRPQGGYIQMPSPIPMRKDLKRNAAAMMKVKNPVNGGDEKEVKVHKGGSVDPDVKSIITTVGGAIVGPGFETVKSLYSAVTGKKSGDINVGSQHSGKITRTKGKLKKNPTAFTPTKGTEFKGR